MTVNDKAEKASTTLATMLDYLGLNANVKVEDRNGKIVLVTYSGDAGRIIGKKGQSLQSLELLVNRMVLRDDTDSPWISIDVDGYSSGKFAGGNKPRKFGKRDDIRKDERGGERKERGERPRRDNRRGGKKEFMSEEQLTQMALDAAKEVKRWGDPLTLSAMNAHDRRIIHMTLKEDNEIDTKSEAVENNDKLKKVIVCLKDK